MELADFDYELPEEAIAQVPVEPRDQARLLVDRGVGRDVEHRVVADLADLVGAGDVLVVNTTRVLPARLRLRKETGGAVEVFMLERTGSGAWDALVRPSRRVAAGTVLVPAEALYDSDDLAVEVGGAGRDEGTRSVRLRVPEGSDELDVLARHGQVPLPPYITAPLDDPERYQTVYAERAESVAAPTAGLHLTPAVLDRCRAAGATVVPVELVVGLGTFRPIQTERVTDHVMHAERYRVPDTTAKACREAHAHGHQVVAVGTTAVRALESAAATGQPEGRTELFIRRPFDWKVVDTLLTNFHLPRSSLLVLLDAFVGPRWRDLYDTALRDGYRFLSFGDAMLVQRTAVGGGAAGHDTAVGDGAAGHDTAVGGGADGHDTATESVTR